MRLLSITGMFAAALFATTVARAETSDLFLLELDDASAWKNVAVPNHDDIDKKKREEPPAKIEGDNRHVKITFDGGEWPTVAAAAPDNAAWNKFRSFVATVTVQRPCVVGFRVMQEKSLRGGDWEPSVSRWDHTQFLHAGANEIAAPLGAPDKPTFPATRGKVTSVEFYMYEPHKGETVELSGLRLSKDVVKTPKEQVNFKVLGTDLSVKSIDELLKQKRHHWTKPAGRTVDQVETDFRAKFDELKKTHPNAVLAIFRDGEKGWNPADPAKVYDGWRDAHVNSHGPDGNLDGRAAKTGKRSWSEVFMRHRSRIMKIDVSSIPAGSSILAAEMMLVRLDKIDEKAHPSNHATMWVAEACNRDWDEAQVNAYQFAKDKFWKAIGGQFYGDDPDFLPLYLAHGPSQGSVNTWDFTEAVKWWTNGANKNFGFFWHTTPEDYWPGNTPMRETAKIKDRPALMVIYEPAAK